MSLVPDNSSGTGSDSDSDDSMVENSHHTLDLCLQDHYTVKLVETANNGSTMITIEPTNPAMQDQTYKLSCSSLEVST